MIYYCILVYLPLKINIRFSASFRIHQNHLISINSWTMSALELPLKKKWWLLWRTETYFLQVGEPVTRLSRQVKTFALCLRSDRMLGWSTASLLQNCILSWRIKPCFVQRSSAGLWNGRRGAAKHQQSIWAEKHWTPAAGKTTETPIHPLVSLASCFSEPHVCG